jgi:hypothetical protein
MRKQRISGHDASALLQGRTPQGRPELEPIAESVAQFRDAAFESAPVPSAELLSLLSAPTLASASATPASRISEVSSARGRVGRKMLGWIAGLGLATKVVLGVSVAAVAGVAGAGAAGVLDKVVPLTQEVVEGVVDGEEMPVPTPSASATWDSTKYENFGKWVSERAHDKDSVDGPFGKLISEAAHQKNAEKRAEANKPSHETEKSETDKPGKPEGSGKPDNPGQGHKSGKD